MAIRWGILGTGKIAHLVASDLSLLPRAELTAIGSRSQSRADAFGDEFDVPHRYDSYEAVVTGADVDVVHVATPHTYHAEHAILAMEAGCAVLCEKPLALNAAEADRIIRVAREREQFLMEGMWTRFLPVMEDVRRVVNAEERLGSVQAFRADIGFHQPFDPEHRMFNPDLGGGALLDLGVYPIAFAFDLFGPPDEVTSTAVLGETDVDEQCAVVFEYEGGLQGLWQASVRADAGRTCAIAGTEGRLEGRRAWWKGDPFVFTGSDGSTETFDRPFEGNGYQFELAHVGRCLRNGQDESPVMPLDESRALLRVADTLRQEWGVVYPGEQSTAH